MKEKQMRRELINEAINLLKEFITSDALLGKDLIKSIRSNDCGDSIIIEDLLGVKKEYSLSEISYVLTDNIDGLGAFDKNLLKTIKNTYDKNEEKYEELQKSFDLLQKRLREIEKNA